MKRSPELEALGQGDDPVIADNSVRRKQLVGGAVLRLLLLACLAGAFAAPAVTPKACLRHDGRQARADLSLPNPR